jgi:hypothetical protein
MFRSRWPVPPIIHSPSATRRSAASAGTSTIPSYVLLALPPTAFTSFQFAPVTATVPFTARGLTVGILSTYNDGTIFSSFALK